MKFTITWFSETRGQQLTIVRDVPEAKSASDLQTHINDKALKAMFVSSIGDDSCFTSYYVQWKQDALYAVDTSITNGVGYNIKTGDLIVSIPASGFHRFYEIFFSDC